ncbi:MAG TPA: UbiA-like protein EboC [Sphingobacteriaceae bacterium]|nr:UbiA-like protein EboC [Sphingobacteriaceae bacterium]
MNKLIGYLRLMRPANIVTSIADVLAGIAISGILSNELFSSDYLLPIIFLCLSTACLYGGGVVFNDVFDADLDKIERPERAIPSGMIGLKQAAILGSVLLITGIVLALVSSWISCLLAFLIAFFALTYNKWGKHNALLGPLNMGMCRGLNLLLGISILSTALNEWFFLGAIPVIYIYSITMISRGEVHGGNRSNLYMASFLYLMVIGSVLYFSFIREKLPLTLIFMMPFFWMIFKPLIKAIKDPVGKNIGQAVKAGVISLILLDAAWAATFSSFYLAFIIACLLPVSILLAKAFAVT